MRFCNSCGQEKPAEDFYHDKTTPDGRHYSCKACQNERSRNWRLRNAGKVSAGNAIRLAKWRSANKDRYHSHAKKWTASNAEKVLSIHRGYKQRNKNKVAAWRNKHTASRRAAKRRAKPSWANDFFIREAYELAKLREDTTGIKWQVDHIVPLKSKLVCGLHVEHNLQVIPAFENGSKHNRYWPDMP